MRLFQSVVEAPISEEQRKKIIEEELKGQIYDPDSYALIQADERAERRGVEATEELIEEIEDPEKTLPGTIGMAALPPGVEALPAAKKYMFPKKPIPYAPSVEKIWKILQNWSQYGLKDRHKHYFECSYLFAGRVSENLELRQQDFEITNIEGMEFLKGNFITLKTRRAERLMRNPIVPFDGNDPQGKIMGKICENFANWLTEFSPKEKLFSSNRQTIWRILNSIDIGPLQAVKVEEIRGTPKKSVVILDPFYCYPHLLRHARLTHLKTYYHWDAQMLREFVNWSDSRMADRYVHLDMTDMAREFKRRVYG